MKKISYWGKNHPWLSRIIITISLIVLSLIALNLGHVIKDSGYIIPSWFYILTLSTYFITVLLYPYFDRKRNFTAAAFYLRRKSCDGLLTLSTFALVLYLGNHPGQLFNYTGNLKAAIPSESILPVTKDPGKYKSIQSFYSSVRDASGKLLNWKERRVLLKAQLKAIRHSDTSKGTRIMLTILSILAAGALLYGVLALSCALSCDGSVAGALIVGIGGTALVIFLLVLALRGINGHHRKRKPDTPENKGT
jgi:hypothetical protein